MDALEKAVERASWQAAMDRVRAAERERCAQIAETEPEPEGPMPVEINQHNISDIVRGTVRATRVAIAARIRSNQ